MLTTGDAQVPVSRPQRYEEYHSGTVQYGIFAKSRYTGIFRYGISLIFSYRDSLEIVRYFSVHLFIGAISDQFRIFHNCMSFCHQNITKESENV